MLYVCMCVGVCVCVCVRACVCVCLLRSPQLTSLCELKRRGFLSLHECRLQDE